MSGVVKGFVTRGKATNPAHVERLRKRGHVAYGIVHLALHANAPRGLTLAELVSVVRDDCRDNGERVPTLRDVVASLRLMSHERVVWAVLSREGTLYRLRGRASPWRMPVL